MVRQWQDMFFNKRYASTELVNPDFLAIASAYNISKEVADESELKSCLNEMLAAEGLTYWKH